MGFCMAGQLQNKTVVLGVTGSIAAYKAADLVSLLVKAGADVFPVMTREATEFITPLTLQVLSRNPAAHDLWQEGKGWQPGHIDLADRADLLLVAPCTAHTLACFAQGLAPDLLTSIYLATRAPVLIAPAMNGKMWEHPATRANVATLTQRGHQWVDPVEGMLACGYEGCGKLAPLEAIMAKVEGMLVTA
jgi:phosphopantothenoylcysteine decarboxylase